jgi:secreted trypsin-like serine protease
MSAPVKNTNLSLLASASIVVFAGCAVPASDAADEVTDVNPSSIVGGVEAVPGEWDGAIFLQKGGRLACGGTLIADQWVLTAGHCVTVGSATGGVSGVVIGRHKQSQTSEGVVITVDRAIRHAEYGRPQRYDNDIALLHLTAPAPATASRAALIKPEQLAQLAQLTTAGGKVWVVGWGTTSAGGSISDVLRKVEVPLIENATCKAQSGYSGVSENMICAGDLANGGIDSCQGDSGGPLYVRLEDKWAEIGLTSWGIGCAGRQKPGVYTRVGNYIGWIFTQTEGAAGTDPNPPAPPVEPPPVRPN